MCIRLSRRRGYFINGKLCYVKTMVAVGPIRPKKQKSRATEQRLKRWIIVERDETFPGLMTLQNDQLLTV